jgi:hypothetical protein
VDFCPPEEAAERLYTEMNGITKIAYTPQKFTLTNHMYRVSITEAKNRKYIKYNLTLVRALKENYPNVIIEAHLGKGVSSKYYKGGLELVLANA